VAEEEIMDFRPKLILWHGFLDNILEPERANQESCAWIFADLIADVWHVLEVKNVGLKHLGDTVEKRIRHSFAPDKNSFAKAKRWARKQGLTRIGCVHTHVVHGSSKREIEYQLNPSEADLKYARKYGDIVRAVIVVSYPTRGGKGILSGIIWFDQYGNDLSSSMLGIK